jgi:signal transduction histidine kinase
MLNKLVQWHRGWEDEMLEALRNPASAVQAPSGYRRKVALKLAAMSAIERQQLHDFSARYRGVRFYRGLGMLLLLLALTGSGLFFAFPSKMGWLETVIVTEMVGVSLSMALIGIWFNYRRLTTFNPKRIAETVAITALCMLLGMAAATLVDGKPLVETLVRKAPKLAQGVLIVGGGMMLLLGLVALYRNRQYETLNTALQHDAEREKLARQLSEAQLRLLRSQIEPHFLFNTLGAVQQLAEQGAPRAAALTSDLIDFLRASMEEMRVEQVSLAEEFALVGAYLKVMQVRLGSRLAFTLRLPEELGTARLPGMVVLTLAENAIKHGIEPALRGGEIEVSAALLHGALQLQVRDSGAGLAAVPADGFGLQNVRERLALSYGQHASLELRDAPGGGAIAELRLPLAQA